MKGCVFTVGIGSVDGVCSGTIYFDSCELLGFGNGILKLGAFVEGVEAEFLDEVDAVNLDFVDFGTKFYFFGFFSANDGADVGFVEADDSIFDGFTCFEHLKLLLEHLFDRLSSDGKSVCVCDGVVCFDVVEDAIEFCEESKEGSGDASALFFGFSAHACIFGVCSCPLVEFCAWKWNVRFLADFLDVFVEVADAFPEELLVGGVAEAAFVAGGVHGDFGAVVHVGFPVLGEYFVEFVDVEALSELAPYLADNFIVCDLLSWSEPYATEELVVKVAVELFDKAVVGALTIGLEKHECDLAFRREVAFGAFSGCCDVECFD